jgi:D-sedoheptulose 7-phosphate isomerase
MTNSWLAAYFRETVEIAQQIDLDAIDSIVTRLARLRSERGRLFLCGVGGSAGNCSHAVNDFRKLALIDASTPVDNVSELTARTNDDGWDRVFSDWLKVARPTSRDVLFILSVGGGNRERNVSPNVVSVVDAAKTCGMDVLGIVGPEGGYTKDHGDIVVVIPTVNPKNITPQTEAFQAVLLHGIVCDPRLMA